MRSARKTILFTVLPIVLAVGCIIGIFFIAAAAADYNPAGRGGRFTQDFYYVLEKDYNGVTNARIKGLTPKAAEKDSLIIPVSLDGYTIESLSYGVGCGYRNPIKSRNLKNLYLPQIDLQSVSLYEIPNVKKIILYNYSYLYAARVQDFAAHYSGITIYVSSFFYNSAVTESIDGRIKAANVSYMYNYDESPNYGYYFIDDRSDELISVTPPNPEREGCEFGGWYCESDCINEWKFDSYTVPKGGETKLFAKWTEK